MLTLLEHALQDKYVTTVTGNFVPLHEAYGEKQRARGPAKCLFIKGVIP